MDFQLADYVMGAIAVAAAVTGLFRGFSGTLAFALATVAGIVAGRLAWPASVSLSTALWARGALVLVAALLAFGIVRAVAKRLVNGLLAQPADALLGALAGAAIGAAVPVVWAWLGLYTEYSAVVRAVMAYVR